MAGGRWPADELVPQRPSVRAIPRSSRRQARSVTSGKRLHDLRHFYASGSIAAGCDVVTLQRALGHKSATVTSWTYSHLWPTAEDRTRKAAQSMVLSALADWLRTERPGNRR